MIQEEPFQENQPQVSAFWPLFIISVSLIILLSYQVTLVFGQRIGLQRQIQQQTETVTRANQTQSELQRVVMELIALADSGDADAKAIVAKYKISNSGPATPAK